MAKMTPADVGKLFGVNAHTIRLGLQQGIFDFGVAFKKPGSTTYSYIIYPEKVREKIGGNHES